MKCLVDYHEELTDQCGEETSRAARMALWGYKVRRQNVQLRLSPRASEEGHACRRTDSKYTSLRLQKGNAMTEVCDSDVQRSCAAEQHRSRGVWSIGAVGRCLSKQLALGKRLRDDCAQLIRAAAPPVRYFALQSMFVTSACVCRACRIVCYCECLPSSLSSARRRIQGPSSMPNQLLR